MSRITNVRFALEKLLDAARQMKAELDANPVRPHHHETEHTARLRKLQGFDTHLRIAKRELQSMQHWQMGRADRSARLPRDARWREHQAVDANLDSIRQALALAQELAFVLADIDRSLHGPLSLAEFIQGLHGVGDEWAQVIDKRKDLEEFFESMQQGPAIRSNAREVTASDMAGQVVLAVLVVGWLVRKLRR